MYYNQGCLIKDIEKQIFRNIYVINRLEKIMKCLFDKSGVSEDEDKDKEAHLIPFEHIIP